jgi:hypothetical protein
MQATTQTRPPGDSESLDGKSRCSRTFRCPEDVIRVMEERIDDLDADGLNSVQVLGDDLMVFLSSQQGREFTDHLRHEIFLRYGSAHRRAEMLKEQLAAVDRELQISSLVFSFFDSVVYRLEQDNLNAGQVE